MSPRPVETLEDAKRKICGCFLLMNWLCRQREEHPFLWPLPGSLCLKDGALILPSPPTPPPMSLTPVPGGGVPFSSELAHSPFPPVSGGLSAGLSFGAGNRVKLCVIARPSANRLCPPVIAARPPARCRGEAGALHPASEPSRLLLCGNRVALASSVQCVGSFFARSPFPWPLSHFPFPSRTPLLAAGTRAARLLCARASSP